MRGYTGGSQSERVPGCILGHLLVVSRIHMFKDNTGLGGGTGCNLVEWWRMSGATSMHSGMSVHMSVKGKSEWALLYQKFHY